MQGAGLLVLRNEDLTPLMPLRDSRTLARLERLNRTAWALLKGTPARVLLASLHGGLMLERLYHRDVMQYRLLIAGRTDGLTPPSARV